MQPIELSALTGAGSAVLAALSYWAKTNHERRRVTRTVLYYLLELLHVTHRVRAALLQLESELIQELRVAHESRNLPFNENEATAAFAAARPHLATFGSKQLEGTVSDSAEAFSKALSDLARENPVLAFRLRGRDQITLLRQKIEDFVAAAPVVDSQQTNSSELQLAQLDPLMFAFAEEELRRAIRATLWGCDVVTHFRTIRLLRAVSKEKTSGEFKGVVKGIVESYVGSLVGQSSSPS